MRCCYGLFSFGFWFEKILSISTNIRDTYILLASRGRMSQMLEFLVVKNGNK